MTLYLSSEGEYENVIMKKSLVQASKSELCVWRNEEQINVVKCQLRSSCRLLFKNVKVKDRTVINLACETQNVALV
jgi:hypothetical protein